MKKIGEKNIELYDEQAMDLAGSTKKMFVRIDSNFLKKYLDIAITPSSSYVTYLDDFVKENYNPETHEIPLKYVSVLLKKQRWQCVDDTIFREVIGSRIANALGIPTVYNELVKYKKEKYVMSIDFVKSGQEIESFEYDESKDNFIVSNSNLWERLINGETVNCSPSEANYDFWEKLFSERTIKIVDYNSNFVNNVNELKRNFVSYFLLKNVILDDADFRPKNVTLIKDLETGNFDLAPINDYEFIFSGRKEKDFNNDVKNYIEYIAKRYPQELNEFTNKIQQVFYKNGMLQDDVLKRLVSLEDTNFIEEQEMLKQFRNNVSRFMRTVKIYENTHEELVS